MRDEADRNRQGFINRLSQEWIAQQCKPARKLLEEEMTDPQQIRELKRLRRNAKNIRRDAEQYITDVESYNDNNRFEEVIPVDPKMRRVVVEMAQFIANVDERLHELGVDVVDLDA